MADIKKFTLGHDYHEGAEDITGDDYNPVGMDCRDDAAPQIYLSIPLAVEINETLHIIETDVCVWVDQEAVEKLQEVVDELRSRHAALIE